MCSLESQPSHYIGPLQTNLELKAALQALAYKKEIIMTTESRAEVGAQYFSNFQRAGYGHILMMTEFEPLCRHLATVFTKLGCGWYPEPTLRDPALSKMFHLNSQYPKLMLGARIIRHGYNVMIMDSDTIIANDFYAHVKQPPLADIQLLANHEGNNSINVNGGWFYVQNASPNGPIAWAFADTMIRFARLVLKPEGIRALGHTFGYCYDQSGIHDTLFSTYIGRPYFQACAEVAQDNPLRAAWNEAWWDLTRRGSGAPPMHPLPYKVRAGEGMRARASALGGPVIDVTDLNRGIVNNPGYRLDYTTMHLPHINGAKATELGVAGWPEQLGGHIYGEGPIPPSIAQLIHDFLIQDVDAPYWPDLEDPSTVAAAAAHPTESMAYPPWWLVNTYTDQGWKGSWNSKLTNVSMTVVGHIWAGFPPGAMQKQTFMKCSNLYDYEVSARLHRGPDRVYPGCNRALEALPPVLAYAHGVIGHTTTQDQFGLAVADLGQVAVVSRHLIGWPGAPLAAGWTHTTMENPEGYGVSGKPHALPWTYINRDVFMAFAPNDTLEELSGVWTPLFGYGCVRSGGERRKLKSEPDPESLHRLGNLVAGGRRLTSSHHRRAHTARGLMPPDLKDYVSRLAKESSTPGPHNTMRAPLGTTPGADGVFEVTVEYVRQESERMAAEPMVWLGQRMRVRGLEGEDQRLYTELWTDCCAMQYAAYKDNKSHLPGCQMFRYTEKDFTR
ncbi:MAG: hypothetical protein WDW36_003303 [Sanguina aurantia]